MDTFREQIRLRSSAPRVLAMLLVTASLAGCSILTPRERAGSTAPLERTDGSNPDLTPFTLELLEELNVGRKLTISGRVTPKTTWDASKVLVRLSALDESGDSRLAYFAFGNGAPGNSSTPGVFLQAGVPTQFSLSIPSEGITNYQLELLWGNDAEPFIKLAQNPETKSGKFVALRNLEAHRVPGDECSDPDACTLEYTITGEFFNSGAAVVRTIHLVAGFLPANKLDLPDQKLENERRIVIRNLNLGPANTKPFRLVLEKGVTAVDQVAPRPVVRITSFEAQ